MKGRKKLTPQEKKAREEELKNENPNAKYIRIAKPRVQRIIDNLFLLSRMSTVSVYEITEENKTKMFNAIDKAVNDFKASFTVHEKKKEVEI